ncbi:MAG: 50S ribosomal protein L3 [candidate division KSB1 bacterium]|nr:50S ribosomal protein L3 [candidate division KSB1 bacterium]MDZ7294359.1 50S ribosomal protein L3 [candidate division KSB1 bacterium]MDZ7384555.1 50S ribosomal protein L3 [candidate division KSB1 bacterium]MDZ7392852.1 50S ribosomal protein L3 [candidate division KSB1 bacterium]
MLGLIGKKVGMTRLFDESGNMVPVTVIEAGPCYVAQIKTPDKDGYSAVQLAFGERRAKVATKPLVGHCQKAGIKPARVLREFRDFALADQVKPGDVLKVDLFNAGDVVTVTGVSKGRGFAGVVKRHHFGGGPKSHGQSDRHRAPGSIGSSSFPSRSFKGLRMAGRMGGETVTVRNLKVVKVDADKNLIAVKGAVPGAPNGIVIIKKK